MYEFLKSIALTLLRCPQEPPEPPAGSYGSVHVFRASPKFLRYRLIGLWIRLAGFLIGGLLGLLFLLVSLKISAMLIGIVILAALIVKIMLLYITIRLDYEMRYYIITDRSLRIREGVWAIREITLTFENIQNMKIEQGPLQRLFGVYDLAVETAGGGGSLSLKQIKESGLTHRGVFRGIERPAELRDQILAYLKAVRTSGLGDTDEFEEGSAGAGDIEPPAAALGEAEMEALRAIARETGQWRRAVGTG
ncbi:PH domain-containing protein [bacterium]|nr:PH domain-containing protein [bacterium]